LHYLIARDASYVVPAGERAGVMTEEFMRYVNLVAGLAFLSGTFVLSVLPASAQDTSNVTGCISMQEQVKTALESNAQSANYRDAVRQKQIAQDYCSSGLYKSGVVHYAEALKLLGVGRS
jgi:hypothetical protein